MPHFFFQIIEGETLPDLDGMELPDLAAARCAAVDIIAERLRGSGEEFWQAEQWRVEISDEKGILVGAISVTAENAAAVQITAKPGCGVSHP